MSGHRRAGRGGVHASLSSGGEGQPRVGIGQGQFPKARQADTGRSHLRGRPTTRKGAWESRRLMQLIKVVPAALITCQPSSQGAKQPSLPDLHAADNLHAVLPEGEQSAPPISGH